MKIAFIVHGYIPWDIYGVPRHIERLSTYLSAKGHEITIITIGRPNLPKVEKKGNITIYRLNYVDFPIAKLRSSWSQLIFTLRCLVEAPKVINDSQIQILNGHTVEWGGMQSILLGLITHRPRVVTVHGSGFERFSKKMPKSLFFLKYADVIITQKLSALNKLNNWKLNCEKIYLTEGCVDSNKYKPASNKQKNQHPVVTFVGRLIKFKGPDLFVQAIPLVLAENSNVEFQIVGEGDLAQILKDQVKQMNLGDKVHFLGFRTDVDEIFRKTDISVHLSPFENFTDFSLLEALSTGVPVVATNSGETSTIVIDGSTGLLSKPNPKDIANKILRLLKDPELAETISINSRKIVTEEYSIEIFGKKAEDLFAKTIKKMKN